MPKAKNLTMQVVRNARKQHVCVMLQVYSVLSALDDEGVLNNAQALTAIATLVQYEGDGNWQSTYACSACGNVPR